MPEPPSHWVSFVLPPLPEAETVQMLVLSDCGQERWARGLSSANQMLPLGALRLEYVSQKGRDSAEFLPLLMLGVAFSGQNPEVAS